MHITETRVTGLWTQAPLLTVADLLNLAKQLISTYSCTKHFDVKTQDYTIWLQKGKATVSVYSVKAACKECACELQTLLPPKWSVRNDFYTSM